MGEPAGLAGADRRDRLGASGVPDPAGRALRDDRPYRTVARHSRARGRDRGALSGLSEEDRMGPAQLVADWTRMFLEKLVGEEWAIAAAFAAGIVTMGAMYLLVREPRDQNDHDSTVKE